MTKLDEIKARLLAPAGWADERRRIDCELLMRAVRQLGAAPKIRATGGVKVYWDGQSYQPIDLDVLELIANLEQGTN